MNEADGQLHTLSVLEQLREVEGPMGASSAAYFRVDELRGNSPIPTRYPAQPPFRVEMWDQSISIFAG
jgi:hypothetical protein